MNNSFHNFMNKLPPELQRYIFSLDSTYHENYQYDIMPYLEHLWTVKYIYKHSNERGIDLSHLLSGPFCTEESSNHWVDSVYLDYSYKYSKKICDYLISENKEFHFIPEHKYYGDFTCHNFIGKNPNIIIDMDEYNAFHSDYINQNK